MQPIIYLGLDIAKHSLELNPHPKLKSVLFANNDGGCRRLAKAVAALGPAHIICEATGGYERTVLKALHQSGLAVTRMNPRQVRDFARAKGQLAKTDRLDAALLAHYGQQIQPAPTQPLPPVQERLRELVRHRDDWVKRITEEKARQEHYSDRFICRQARRLLRHLEKALAETEKEIAALVQADQALSRKIDRLCQIKGVGPRTAWILLADLPELGSLERGQAAALAGVAPYNRDSGPYRGQRHIAQGRSLLRKGLYMAALVSSRHNTTLRSHYERLIRRGKPAKVALVALMRKIIELANLLLKRPDWQLNESAASSEP